MNDSCANELVPRGTVRRETNNYSRANRMNDTIRDEEEKLPRGTVVGRETNRRENRMNNNVDEESSESDESTNMFERGTPAVNDYNSIVDSRRAAMGGHRRKEQEAGLMLHKKNVKSKYVVDHVQGFVKNHLFRKVKFITKQKMLEEVMEVVEETEEGVTDDDVKRMAFRKLYKSSVMEALNARRSTCDQMGCKIVQRYLSQTWLPNPAGGEEDNEGIPSFLSIETLSKLRRSETEEERKAFVWFFAEFMDCICGKRAWGKQKYTQLISDASSLDDPGEKLLTVSDEAFGLLLVENYMEKWVKKFHIQRKGLMLGRLDGVYTAATKGNLVFGGWTKQGRSRFNYFCKLVQDDRSSDRSAHVEKEFLVAMQKTPEGKKIQDRLLKRAARVSRNDDDESEEDIYYEKLVYSHQQS